MDIRQGSSSAPDSGVALAEAISGMDAAFQPDLVVAFVSIKHDPAIVSRDLTARFPSALVVGCTTAGEIVDGRRGTDSLAVSAMKTPSVRWAGRLVRGVRASPDLEGTVASLCEEIGCDRESYAPNTFFAMAMIDGMSVREEAFGAALAEALAGIPLVGGSAGDGLAFKETTVLLNGEAATDAAVVVLAHAAGGFELIKHQHYLPTTKTLAVTAADPATRRVDELDGRPAAHAYAAALGVPNQAVVGGGGSVTFMNPVTFSCGGDAYVRSVRTVDPDGAMHFYCAVEEGMVLEISGREEMVQALGRTVSEHLEKHGQAEVFIGFNCILRALEMEQLGANEQLACEWSRLAKRSIGFDTYGELWNGLHINQTLVGIALHEPSARAA
jgi:hypothetical protein